MPFIAARPLILALLAIWVTLMARSDAAVPPSLKGQLLIATDSMRDSRFDHAVILMVRHDIDGAMGIVINRPLGERPLAELLAAFGTKDTPATGNVRIFLGGPVQPEVSFVIHGADYGRPETLEVDARFAATPSREVLRDLARNAGPMKSLIAFGYAGWAAGQLEDELQRRVWFTTAGEPKLIFDEDRKKIWESAYSHRTQDL